jgi:hypothetical protein
MVNHVKAYLEPTGGALQEKDEEGRMNGNERNGGRFLALYAFRVDGD